MRVRFNPNSKEELMEFDRYLTTKEALQKIIQDYIDKGKKVYLEIGMGKGTFISQMAQNDRDNLYIGIELVETILALAVKKLKRFEEENNTYLDNLYLMSFDAKRLREFFENDQIDKIFLNFSDPWPKSKHAKRRITSESFLSEYKEILKKDGIIEFKTDNRLLFEYSIISMQNFGLHFENIYLDLHKANIFNIMTEYEEKFSKLGPIYKIVVKNSKN